MVAEMSSDLGAAASLLVVYIDLCPVEVEVLGFRGLWQTCTWLCRCRGLGMGFRFWELGD